MTRRIYESIEYIKTLHTSSNHMLTLQEVLPLVYPRDFDEEESGRQRGARQIDDPDHLRLNPVTGYSLKHRNGARLH